MPFWWLFRPPLFRPFWAFFSRFDRLDEVWRGFDVIGMGLSGFEWVWSGSESVLVDFLGHFWSFFVIFLSIFAQFLQILFNFEHF